MPCGRRAARARSGHYTSAKSGLLGVTIGSFSTSSRRIASRMPNVAAHEGIAETVTEYPGLAASLAKSLCEIARTKQQWDIVAAHSAYHFFDEPAPISFKELLTAAQQAGVEDAVREAAFRFLETGVGPYQPISPFAPAANRSRSMRKAALAGEPHSPAINRRPQSSRN